jgi:hypothetical protein
MSVDASTINYPVAFLFPSLIYNSDYLAMSQSGPPADAKQAQAAAIQEIEAAKKKKNAIDSQLVGSPAHSITRLNLMNRPISKNQYTGSRGVTLTIQLIRVVISSR